MSNLPNYLPTYLPTYLPPSRKKVLYFFWNFAHLKFTMNKCAQFSRFLIFIKNDGKKSDLCLKFRKKFTSDFHTKFFSVAITCKMNLDYISREFSCHFFKEVRKKCLGDILKKWTQIKFQRNSLIMFSRRSGQFIKEFLHKIYEGFAL